MEKGEKMTNKTKYEKLQEDLKSGDKQKTEKAKEELKKLRING